MGVVTFYVDRLSRDDIRGARVREAEGGSGFWIGSAIFGGGYLFVAFMRWPDRLEVVVPPLLSGAALNIAEPRVFSTGERMVTEGFREGEDLKPPMILVETEDAFVVAIGRPDFTQIQKVISKKTSDRTSYNRIADSHQYRRVGHILFALMAYLLGGLIGRLATPQIDPTATQI